MPQFVRFQAERGVERGDKEDPEFKTEFDRQTKTEIRAEFFGLLPGQKKKSGGDQTDQGRGQSPGERKKIIYKTVGRTREKRAGTEYEGKNDMRDHHDGKTDP